MNPTKIGAGAALAILLLSLAAVSILAVHTLDLFELDGNALDDPAVAGDDWESSYSGTGSALVTTFVNDPTSRWEDDVLTGGGSKDLLDFNDPLDPFGHNWLWKTGSVPDKDNLTNAYAALYEDEGELILYLGADRYANRGNAGIGFWILQGEVSPNPDGTFDGVHQVGDILVAGEFTRGGAGTNIDVYEWVGTGGDTYDTLNLVTSGADCASAAPDDLVCATVNGLEEVAPWPYTPMSGTPGYFPPGTFFEGGLNLTQLLPGGMGCSFTILAETRASHAIHAQLQDFALLSLNLCGLDVTKTGDALSKVGDSATYTVTVDNTSALTLYRESIVDSLVGDLTDALNPGLISSTCGESLPAPSSCAIVYSYPVTSTDFDPLPNTVDVIYNTQADLAGEQVTGSSSWEVNLFQPAIAVEKTGDLTATVGDVVDYAITLTNSSSVDTPDLICTADDSLLGTVFDGVLPLGQTMVNLTRTVQAGDPNPLVNTVTLICSPGGFSNSLEATASHSTTLLLPALAVTKTGDVLSTSGGIVTYTVMVENTGVFTLYKESIVDSLAGDLTDGTSPAIVSSTCGDSLPGPSWCAMVYTYTITAGDPDPLPNTVDVIYNTQPDLGGAQVTGTSSWQVNLFQPAVEIAKGGPAQAAVGDTITYHFTVTNASSVDSPALLLDSVTDTVLGDLTSAAGAAGCGTLLPGAACTFPLTYTVQPTDPDPLINVVTVHYHPDGFQLDITGDDDHELPITTITSPPDLRQRKSRLP